MVVLASFIIDVTNFTTDTQIQAYLSPRKYTLPKVKISSSILNRIGTSAAAAPTNSITISTDNDSQRPSTTHYNNQPSFIFGAGEGYDDQMSFGAAEGYDDQMSFG